MVDVTVRYSFLCEGCGTEVSLEPEAVICDKDILTLGSVLRNIKSKALQDMFHCGFRCDGCRKKVRK